MEQLPLFPDMPDHISHLKWIDVSGHSLPTPGVEVIGYSKEWVHPDFNPNGVRVCYVSEQGRFTSAYWSNSADEYITDTKSIPTHYCSFPKTPDKL